MLAIESPYPQFFGLDGSPLDAGNLYFGQVNQSPETSPVTVYWDAALTQPAAQPIRTLNGYPVRNGAPAMVYAAADYSLTIRDRRGRLVATAPSSAEYSLGSAIALIRTDLASTSDATKGPALVGFNATLNYATATIGWHDVQEVWVTDFPWNADPTGATDSRAAIQACIDFFTQKYTAYPKFDMYSTGTLKTGRRVRINFGTGKYLINPTGVSDPIAGLDLTYRGFIHLKGENAEIIAGGQANMSALVDMRWSNEMLCTGIVFNGADDGGVDRFLDCVRVGGHENRVLIASGGAYDSTINCKAVHFQNCEFRNPGDTCLNTINPSSTVSASADNSDWSNLFFAGGGVGLKYAGYQSWLSRCNFASQTYAGVLFGNNARLNINGVQFTEANACPALLFDTDTTGIKVDCFHLYAEQCTYVVQALGTGASKAISLRLFGGELESCQNGLIAMSNRLCTVGLHDVEIGNTNVNTAISCSNTSSTLVLEQNQLPQDFGGAMANLASWLGKVQRFGFLAGNPVNYGPTGTVAIYVDPAAGSDFNEGYSSNRALATLGEAIRRANSTGSTSIYLASGPDGAPRTYSPPANFEIWTGRIVLLPWEKHAGSATAINLRTILDCSANKVAVWGGLVELQNLTVQGGRAVLCYEGVATALSCVFPAAGANGALFGRMCRYTIKDCTFNGAGTDVGVYVGDQFGAMGALYSGGGNTWGAVTKYAAFSGITTHITSNL
ncbi:MAG TPA: glycosyl hydrolase family 28-related protein [Roseateles sp.]